MAWDRKAEVGEHALDVACDAYEVARRKWLAAGWREREDLAAQADEARAALERRLHAWGAPYHVGGILYRLDEGGDLVREKSALSAFNAPERNKAGRQAAVDLREGRDQGSQQELFE